MAVEVTLLADFTGGEINAISAVEPRDGEWLLLEGLVLDSNGRLRSQWPGVSWFIQSEEES